MFKPKSNRRGAAAVEFAIVAPLFVLLLLGMLEVGHSINITSMLANAAREGARVAVSDEPTTTTAKVNSAVISYLTTAGAYGHDANGAPRPVTDAVVTITPPGWETLPAGEAIQVQVTLDRTKVSWVKNNFIQSNPTYTAAMRKEGTQ